MLWSSALVMSRTVIDPTDTGMPAQEARAWKGPASLRNSRTERTKALRGERVRQDQVHFLEQRRTRGCTTQDACFWQKQSGQWNCRWETGPLAVLTYEPAGETSCRACRWKTGPAAVVTYEPGGETSCRAWWTETGSTAADECTESHAKACVCAQIKKMPLCIH